MPFAINWSPEAAELIEAGAIQLDLYKCPQWPDVIEKAQTQRPSYVHFPIEIGKNQHPDWDFNAIENWLKQTDTRFVNSHITPSTPHFTDDISVDDLAEALTKEVQQLVDEFGAEKVIIENCPYWDYGFADDYLPQGMQPELFQQITQATGCGLLLDVSHAILTCDKLDKDWQSYIKSLPVDRIRELHITGIGTWTTGIRGDHMPLTDSDWENVEWCFEQIRAGTWATPEVIAFEYGGIAKLKEWTGSDKAVIAEQVPRLYTLVDGVSQPKVSHD